MINTFIGNLGHFFVITSFVSSLVAAYGYIMATRTHDLEAQSWRRFARNAFYAHGLLVLGVVGTLFYIIYNHLFEYHYAWTHSSRSLPIHYMISCFWEGQEGSFLLWIFWHVVLGVALIVTNRNKTWEAPVMAVFALVQAFLVSMILGVVLGDAKIGSSPFMLLRDVMDAPVFAMNPDYVPEDGTGLNPLLQNYWMVIHPPTLFLGFATTLVPFAFCIAGMWQKRYEQWVRPALLWALFSGAVLGLGIIMGAIWAYETLNFGGYWNWDPVENAIYVPWLVLVAAIHTLVIFKNNGTALKTSVVLVVSTFILVLYSTFLARSGILGDASVHSFTDLGLSGQLLVYMFFFSVGAIILAAMRWKEVPTSEKEASAYSREFWIFIGATTLCLMGFQVLVPTSIPVYNAIVEMLGGVSNVAPPADQVGFYTKFQLWFAVVVALLSGTGQFFFWRKMDIHKLQQALTVPFIITLVLSTAAILLGKITNWIYIVLLTASIYSIVANSTILLRFLNDKIRLAGGSIAHIGVAMMLIGILFSAGYSKVVSINRSGLLLVQDAPDDFNVENVLLWIDEPREMNGYELVYKGTRAEIAGVPGYVDKDLIRPTPDEHIAIARQDYYQDGTKYFSKGDSLKVSPENTYHEIAYTQEETGEQFSLYPRTQMNPSMGFIASPAIHKSLTKDMYTHASMVLNEEDRQWSEPEEMKVKMGERFFINDYVASLQSIERVTEVEGVDLQPNDLAVEANIKVFGENKEYILKPVYLIRDRMVGKVPYALSPLGIRVSLSTISPEENAFTFEVETSQKDFIVMKAIEKPLINVLWIGTLVMLVGFSIAIYRRYIDLKKGRAISPSKPATRQKRSKREMSV